MATSTGNISSDILSCPICLEKLNNPKYLPCLHTFCTGCIQTYITSAFEKGNVENINCPICRSISTIPQEKRSPEHWAQQLPENFLILGLLEKEKVHRQDKKCMSCERMGVQSDPCVICLTCSDMLCEVCHRYHKANKVSCDHEIRPLSEIDSEELYPKALNISRCSKHNNKKLKLFCLDHDLPCCSMCVSLDHRKCEKVVQIEDAAKQYITDKTVEKIEQNLISCETDMKSIVSHNKEILEDLEKQYKEKFQIVDDLCKDLKQEIEDFEIKKKSELEKLYDQRTNDIETHNVILENNLKAISNEREILRVCKSEITEAQVMLEAMKVEQRVENHEQILKEKSTQCNLKLELVLENTENVKKTTSTLNDLLKVNITERRTSLDLITFHPKTMHTLNRFKMVRNNKWGMKRNSTDSIYFTVSKEISLIGIVSYCCNLSVSSAKLTLTINNPVLAETTITLDAKSALDNLIEVKYSEPVPLQPNTRYRIVIRIYEDYKLFFYGTDGQSPIECNGIVFKFEKDPESNNGTDVHNGQIPGFIFTV